MTRTDSRDGILTLIDQRGGDFFWKMALAMSDYRVSSPGARYRQGCYLRATSEIMPLTL